MSLPSIGRTTFEALGQDIRHAVRGLRSRPGFTLVVATTIAVGIGGNAVMFGILDRLLLRPPEHVADPSRVVEIGVRESGEEFTNSSFPYAALADFRSRVPGFASVAAYTPAVIVQRQYFPLGHGASAERIAGSLVTSNFFRTLGVEPRLGRFFVDDDDSPDDPRDVAVIGYAFWQGHFAGRANVIGQPLDIGSKQYRIVGVAPAGFTGVELTDIDVWLPIASAQGLRFDRTPNWVHNRDAQWLTLIARLAPGQSPQVAAAQATVAQRAATEERIATNPKVAKYLHPESEHVVLTSIVPGESADTFGSVSANDVKVSKLLGAVAIVVLIIACANVANLLLVRAFNRRREIAIRLALGISRSRLVVQLLMEGLVLAALGAGGALLVARFGAHFVRALLLGEGAWTSGAVNWRVVAFTTVLAGVTGIATSLVPALQSTHTDLATSLKQGAREGSVHRSRTRVALLVVQAALAIVLLSGAGLFIRSMRNVAAQPFGMDVDHVLVGHIQHGSVGMSNAEALRTNLAFIERVKRVPGVRDAAVSIGLPFNMSWSASLFVPGRALPELKQQPVQYGVTPAYFDVLGIRLVMGRAFTDGDRLGAAPVAVINETAARLYFPGRSPIGECLRVGADTMPCTTIVGVAANTRRQNIREGLTPQLYRPLEQIPPSLTDRTVSFFGYYLTVRTAPRAESRADAVRRAMQSTGPMVPYANVTPMSALIGRRARAWQLGATVFSAFGAVALFLAVLGLYSVLAFSIAQRLPELGVRVALGARPADLVRLTVVRGVAPAIAGIVVGVGLALASGKAVAALLFDVAPNDPAVLAAASALLLAAGLVASVGPAFRAARADPMQVLRTD
ncbi:MAG TPA: ABC transporter permease [Gemmatimonadaceae bacterium]